jgi:hypothetical protein
MPWGAINPALTQVWDGRVNDGNTYGSNPTKGALPYRFYPTFKGFRVGKSGPILESHPNFGKN